MEIFIRKFDVYWEHSNEIFNNTMYLTRDYLVNMYLIILRRNSTNNLFNCFDNQYELLKKHTWRRKYAVYIDSVQNLITIITITTKIDIEIIRGLSSLFIGEHFFDIDEFYFITHSFAQTTSINNSTSIYQKIISRWRRNKCLQNIKNNIDPSLLK